MQLKWAMAIELTGLAVVIGCSLLNPPFASTVTGSVTSVQWGASGQLCSCDYLIEVEGQDFPFRGPTRPAGPGPYGGETVEVAYLDTTTGWDVLSITSGPETAGSVTYVTPDGDMFAAARLTTYAGFAGLIAGLVLTVLGMTFFIRWGRGRGAPLGATSGALAPISLVGGVPVVLLFSSVSAPISTLVLASPVWLVSAVAALIFGIASLRRHETPASLAKYALAVTGVVSGVLIIWWIAFAVHLASTIS